MDNIEAFMAMLDHEMEKGVSRLTVQVSDALPEGEIDETYHHGCCLVGSPWAKGTVPNFVPCDETEELI